MTEPQVNASTLPAANTGTTPALRIALTDGFNQVSDEFPPKLQETISAPLEQSFAEPSYLVGQRTHSAADKSPDFVEAPSQLNARAVIQVASGAIPMFFGPP